MENIFLPIFPIWVIGSVAADLLARSLVNFSCLFAILGALTFGTFEIFIISGFQFHLVWV